PVGIGGPQVGGTDSRDGCAGSALRSGSKRALASRSARARHPVSSRLRARTSRDRGHGEQRPPPVAALAIAVLPPPAPALTRGPRPGAARGAPRAGCRAPPPADATVSAAPAACRRVRRANAPLGARRPAEDER